MPAARGNLKSCASHKTNLCAAIRATQGKGIMPDGTSRFSTAKVEAGANIVVFGLGGIGLNVIQGAKLVGANKIVGVDIHPRRKALECCHRAWGVSVIIGVAGARYSMPAKIDFARAMRSRTPRSSPALVPSG